MRGPAIRVLVVCRYPILRSGAAAMLRAPDIRVVGEAETAEDVLRLLKTEPPHLVLLVCEADEPEALDLIRQIKENRPETSVIMLMTKDTVHVAQAFLVGSSGFLDMRVRREPLLRAVRAVARGECVVEPTLLKSLLSEVARQRVELGPPPSEPLTGPENEVLRLVAEGLRRHEFSRLNTPSFGASP